MEKHEDSSTPATPPTGSPLQRALGWLAEHVAGAVVGTVVALAVGAGAAWFFNRSESFGDQLDHVRASLQRQGAAVRYRELRLHQGGVSYVFIISNSAASSRSDELRIYDRVKSALRLELAFRPDVVGPESRETVPSTFRLNIAKDLDRDGQRELLGSYDVQLDATRFRRVPILVSRDSDSGGYNVRPLLAHVRGTAGLPTVDFGPAGGARTPTAWASNLLLDTRGRFFDRLLDVSGRFARTTLVTSTVLASNDDKNSAPSLRLVYPAKACTWTATCAGTSIRFWAIDVHRRRPALAPLCVIGPGARYDGRARLNVGAAVPVDSKAVLGATLIRIMDQKKLMLGDYVEGRCIDASG